MLTIYHNGLLIRLSEYLNLYLDNPIANISDGAKGGFGEINNSPVFKGAAVINLDHHALAIGEVGDPHHRAKGQFHMGCAIKVVAIELAAGGLFTIEIGRESCRERV